MVSSGYVFGAMFEIVVHDMKELRLMSKSLKMFLYRGWEKLSVYHLGNQRLFASV